MSLLCRSSIKRNRESGAREVERAGENQVTGKREDPAGSCWRLSAEKDSILRKDKARSGHHGRVGPGDLTGLAEDPLDDP
jgi:hypothetical protein